MIDRQRLIALVAILGSTSVALAQSDVASMQNVARVLVTHAERCAKAGFVLEARRHWLEVVTVYDPNHEACRKALGHARVGRAWSQETPVGIVEGIRHQAKNQRKLEPLYRRWNSSVAKSAARLHRKAAAVAAKAADKKREEFHLRRVLRFEPGDAKAGRRLGYTEYRSVWAAPETIRALRRAVLLQQTLAVIRLCDPAVRILPETSELAILKRNFPEAPAYRGVRSDNFEIWGDVGVANLVAAAHAAERAKTLIRALYAGARHDLVLRFIIWKDEAPKDHLARVMIKDKRNREFTLKYTSAFYHTENHVRYFIAHTSEVREEVVDRVARCVAGNLVSSDRFACEDGVGHSAVMYLFGKSLTGIVGLSDPDKRTAASKAPEAPLIPEIDVWRHAATEQAWMRSDTPIAKVLLARADGMTNTDRIKAWSFIDYVLMRSPDLLWYLDNPEGGYEPHPRAVKEGFTKRTRMGLEVIEREWRAFKTTDAGLFRRVLQPAKRPPPKALTRWAGAVNTWRVRRGLSRVGWSPAPKGSLNAGALVFPAAADPAKAIDRWLGLPGLRDFLLGDYWGMLDVTSSPTGIAVAIAKPGPLRRRTFKATVYPRSQQENVPRAIARSQLNGIVEGDAGEGQWGYPITLHYPETAAINRATLQCGVLVNGAVVSGKVIVGGASFSRGLLPKNVSVFLADAPFPRGAHVVATWTWKETVQGRKRLRKRVESVAFRTK